MAAARGLAPFATCCVAVALVASGGVAAPPSAAPPRAAPAELPGGEEDDECAADHGDGGACGIVALQMRGTRVAERPTAGQYIGRSLVADEGVQVDAFGDQELSGCEAKCDANHDCHSFTFGISGEYVGQCFLKSQVVGPGDATTAVAWNRDRFQTYYKASTVGGGRYVERSLVADAGAELASYERKTPEECAALCDGSPACRSFTAGFGATHGGQCYLRDRAVSPGDTATQGAPNKEDFRTFYRVATPEKTNPATGPAAAANAKRESDNYLRATSCKPAAVIVTTSMCMAAAEELGISPTRPRVVPPEESALAPGCLVGPGLREWPAGMWFNSLGLQKGFFQAESSQPVDAGEGFELICKREPYKLSAIGGDCEAGAEVGSRGECAAAAEWLKFGPVSDVAPERAPSAPPGCHAAMGALWYNGPLTSLAGHAAPATQRVCRTEAA